MRGKPIYGQNDNHPPAQAFGFAVGAHVTGRLMPVSIEDSEEGNFRADDHDLAVYAVAVIFGLTLAAVACSTPGTTVGSNASTPAIYWADKPSSWMK